MSKRGTQALAEELGRKVEDFRREWKLTYAEVVGVLGFMQHELLTEGFEAADDMDEENGDDEEGSPVFDMDELARQAVQHHDEEELDDDDEDDDEPEDDMTLEEVLNATADTPVSEFDQLVEITKTLTSCVRALTKNLGVLTQGLEYLEGRVEDVSTRLDTMESTHG